MFNMLASKIGEAQAFADGLVNLDALSMDRLLEEQEREERSKDESLRLLRASGDPTDVAYFHEANVREERESSRITAAATVDDDIELQQLSTDSHKFRSPEAEDEGNFEDEFDPILASIRKPASRDPGRASPTRRSASPTPTGQATAASGSTRDGFESSFLPGESRDRDPDTSPKDDRGKSAAAAGANGAFASGLLSMFPGNMRARAEGVMAQSSASISKSAGAFRSALETGGASAAGKGKRRESDPPPYPTDAASRAEEGRGKNGAGGGRRMVAGDTDEDDVPMVNVNDLLSDDERRQLASFSGGAGRTRGVCGWRRRPKYVLVGAAVGVALIGVYCLWRWTALMLGLEEDGVAALNAGRR